MMDAPGILAAIVIPALAGGLFVRWAFAGKEPMTLIETVSLGFGLGMGFISLEIFLAGLLRVPFTLAYLAPPPLLLIPLFFFLGSNTGIERHVVAAEGRLRGVKLVLAAILSIWILIKIGFVFYECFNRPIYSWDAFINWSVSAKLFFYRKGLVLNPSDEHFFGRGYRVFYGYPLHFPLLEVWVSLWLGRFHEILSKAPSFFYFIAVLGLLYGAVKREATTLFALMAVFFMASAPLFTFHGQDAYSDLPLSYFVLASVVLFWRFMRSGEKMTIILSGVFMGMALFVKTEGLLLLFALFVALVAYLIIENKATAVNLLRFLVPIAILAGPWLVFNLVHHLGFGHGEKTPGLKGGVLVHWEVLGGWFRAVFLTANYNLVYSFWAVMSVLGIRTVLKTDLKYLYIFLVLVMGMFLSLYLVLEFTSVTLAFGIHRNNLTYLPVVFYASALLARCLWSAGRACEEK